MREAIGGSWLFYLVIIFLIVYIFFMAFVMNYASAYRASNYIVSRIEETEGSIDLDSLKNEVKNVYKYDMDSNGVRKTCSNNAKGSVYKVTSYIAFEVPLITVDLKIPVTVESKTIYGVFCG